MNWFEEQQKRIQEEQIETYQQIREWILSNKNDWATIKFRHSDSKFVNFLKILCNDFKALKLAINDKNALQLIVTNKLVNPKTGRFSYEIIDRFRNLIYVDWKNAALYQDQACEILRLMANKLSQDCFNKSDDNAPPASEDDFEFVTHDTASPYVAFYTMADAGKKVYYILRWKSKNGETGEWGETVEATING